MDPSNETNKKTSTLAFQLQSHYKAMKNAENQPLPKNHYMAPTVSSKAREIKRICARAEDRSKPGAGKGMESTNKPQKSCQRKKHNKKKYIYVKARIDTGLRKPVIPGNNKGATSSNIENTHKTDVRTRDGASRKRQPLGTYNMKFVSGPSQRTIPAISPKKPKLSSAQVSAKLDDWLKAKGKTPAKFLHLRNTLTATENKIVDGNAGDLQCSAVKHDHSETALQECSQLYETGCPAHTVAQWLQKLADDDITIKSRALYWVLRIHAADDDGLSYDGILKLFEEAVVHNAQPSEELSKYLKEYIVKHGATPCDAIAEDKREYESTACIPRTPKRKLDVDQSTIFESSAIKFLLSDYTPGFYTFSKRRRTTVHMRTTATPVRRSTRQSLQALPAMLKEHDDIIDKLDDLSPSSRQNIQLQQNPALQDFVSPIQLLF